MVYSVMKTQKCWGGAIWLSYTVYILYASGRLQKLHTLNLQIYSAKVAQKPPLSSINSLESEGVLEKF